MNRKVTYYGDARTVIGDLAKAADFTEEDNYTMALTVCGQGNVPESVQLESVGGLAKDLERMHAVIDECLKYFKGQPLEQPKDAPTCVLGIYKIVDERI